jgi:Flp pilus assembly protein TadD
VRWILAIVAVLSLAAVGLVARQRADRDQQYRSYLDQGDRALQSGDADAAVEAFTSALALRPSSMVASYRRGEAYHSQHRDAAAVRDLTQASEAEPDAPQPLVALGRLYDAEGDPAQAATWYAQAVDRLKDEDASVLYALALARYRSGTPSAALDPLHRAIARNQAVAEPYYLLGLVNRDLGHLDDAEAALTQAVKIGPGLLAAREELADLYRVAGRSSDQMAQLQALAALDPQPDRQIALALAAAHQGQFDAALSALTTASAKAPDDVRVRGAMARVYLARAERTLDRRSAQQALDTFTPLLGSAPPSEDLALCGRAQFLLGNYAEAERLLRAAIGTSPVAPDAYAYMADTAERLGQTADARDALVSLGALEGDTAAKPVRMARARRIGEMAFRAGDNANAAAWLLKAFSGGYEDAVTLGLLAQARVRTGDRAGAREALTKALAQDPRNPDLLRLARTLR